MPEVKHIKANTEVCQRTGCRRLCLIGEGKMYHFSNDKYVDGCACHSDGLVILEKRKKSGKVERPNDVPKDCPMIVEHVVSQEASKTEGKTIGKIV
jgi:hypothetical protein